MRRRLVLAALAVLALGALAGCADAAGSIRMDSVNDTELAERASHETDGAGHYPAIERQRTARRVIENGSTDVVDRRPPLDTSLPYEYRGRYYDLSYDVVDSQRGVETLIRVDYNATDPNGTRLAYDDLSPADRDRVRPVFENDPSFRRPGSEADLTLTYLQPEESTLLAYGGEQVVVSYRGTEYAVEVGEPRDVTLRTYRYETDVVAEGAAAYAKQLTDQYAFTLSDLDDNETEVVESALEDSYYAESTDDAGFDALVDRFRRHEAVERDDYSGTWLVRYEGRRYWVEMNYGAFVEDEESVTPPSATPNGAE